MRSSRYVVLVCCLVALGACGGAEPARRDQSNSLNVSPTAPADAGSDSGASTAPEVATWEKEDLILTSSIVVADGVAVYEGLAGSRLIEEITEGLPFYAGDLMLAAVDIQTGEELWRHDVTPLGRISGVIHDPSVFESAGLVIRYSQPQESLVAADLRTGEVVWESGNINMVYTIYECGADICTSGEDGLGRFDTATGDEIASTQSADGRLLMNEGGIVVVPGEGATSSDGLAEYIGFTDWGFTEAWTISGDEVAQFVGLEVTPNVGWWFDLSEDRQTGVAWVGGALPEGVSTAALAEYEGYADYEIGGIFGFDTSDGRVLWGIGDAYPRLNDGDLVIGVGRSSTQRDESSSSVTFLTEAVTRWDARTGQPLWTFPLGEEMNLVSVTVDEEGSFVGIATPDARWVLDREDGSVVAEDEDVIVSCAVDDYLRPSYVADQDWFRRIPYRLPCHLSDAQLVDPVTVLESGLQPPAAMIDAGDGWWIWVDESGIVHGAGPAA